MSKLEKLEQSSTKTFVDNLNNNFDLMHPVGSVMCMSTQTSPQTIYGGKWEGIDRGYKSLVASDNGNTNNAFFVLRGSLSTAEYIDCAIVRTSNTVRLRLKLTFWFLPTDEEVELGCFDLKKIGIARMVGNENKAIIPYGVYGLAYSDGANSTILYSLNNDGTLKIIDSYYKTTADFSSPQNWTFNIMFNVDSLNMNPEDCDKFYYKRVE